MYKLAQNLDYTDYAREIGGGPMKRLFPLLLSTILIFAITFTFFSASSESATAQLQEMYAQGELLMAQGDYAGAAAQFETLGAYSDASQMAMYCKGIMAAESLGMYDVAVSAFQGLGDFKDSKQLMTYYQGRGYQAAADTWIESEARYDLVNARDTYNEAVKVYSGLALFKDCLTRLSACQSGTDKAQDKINALDYAAADKLEQDGKLEEALKAFQELGDYSDSAERVKAIPEKINARDYAAAEKLEQDGQYEAAIKAFTALGSYSDSAERVKGAQEKFYQKAVALMESDEYIKAIEILRKLEHYKDCKARISACKEAILRILITDKMLSQKVYFDMKESEVKSKMQSDSGREVKATVLGKTDTRIHFDYAHDYPELYEWDSNKNKTCISDHGLDSIAFEFEGDYFTYLADTMESHFGECHFGIDGCQKNQSIAVSDSYVSTYMVSWYAGSTEQVRCSIKLTKQWLIPYADTYVLADLFLKHFSYSGKQEDRTYLHFIVLSYNAKEEVEKK